MRLFVVILMVVVMPHLSGFSLKDKVVKGAPGDYVVTEQAGTYTVLLMRAVKNNHLLLEEIDVPTIHYDPSNGSWKEWIALEAPGHTAWVTYLIDLDKNELVESYSHSRHAWLYANDPNHFLARLLTLTLEKTPNEKRKRIGPLTSHTEEDHRALWLPSVVVEGKKQEKATLSAWTARWPDDGSLIAGCEVELYFTQFPFPYWIEIRSPHYKASMRTVDSGQGLISPQPIVFQNSPFFIGGGHWKNGGIDLHVHAPKYFSEFSLHALDITQDHHPMIDLISSGKTVGGEIVLHVPEEVLESNLLKNHRYRWVLTSKEYPTVVIYSDATFQW